MSERYPAIHKHVVAWRNKCSVRKFYVSDFVRFLCNDEKKIKSEVKKKGKRNSCAIKKVFNKKLSVLKIKV